MGVLRNDCSLAIHSAKMRPGALSLWSPSSRMMPSPVSMALLEELKRSHLGLPPSSHLLSQPNLSALPDHWSPAQISLYWAKGRRQLEG